MEFMTGYYRRKEEPTSLLLQHYVCLRVPVCLGCICGGESREAGIAGGLFTGRLLGEFRRLPLRGAAGNPEKYLKKMDRRMRVCLEGCGVSGDFWMAGILCAGDRFLLFSMGEVMAALCNAGFGRPALCGIGENRGAGRRQLQIHRGSMEPGIGILLVSKNLFEKIPREDIQNCLAVKEIGDSLQTQKRMQEIGGAAERRGGRNMAALLLEVRQGKEACGGREKKRAEAGKRSGRKQGKEDGRKRENEEGKRRRKSWKKGKLWGWIITVSG